MYAEDIKQLTKNNTNFRTVLHTGTHSQIVAMCIPVGGEIGEETHNATDQMLFFVEGEGAAILNNESRQVEKHDVVFVPAGFFEQLFQRADRRRREPVGLVRVRRVPDDFCQRLQPAFLRFR